MSVPFSGRLPKRLEDGDKICLRGIIAEDATEFTVALVCIDNCDSETENVAYFHKVNFDEGSSILNHKIDGDWQQEDMTDPIEINRVYVPGESFHVQLIIKDDDTILVYCNEQFITKHNVPLRISLQSTHIQIWDGLNRVESMSVEFA